tara:strand:+ start:857 stop:1132 length:276 start_codon:yes stop_codon:yes gene_type:complete
MSKVQTTSVNNAQLKIVVKLCETTILKAEKGEWKMHLGTLDRIGKAAGHIRCEMQRQKPPSRKPMMIENIIDPEQQMVLANQIKERKANDR